jgi:hypothetical protein
MICVSLSRSIGCSIIGSLLALVAIASPEHLQGGPVRAAGRELLEALARSAGKPSGKMALDEIAELGGEVAVREVGERVLREGGEESLDTLLRFTRTYGKEALRAVQHDASSPRLLGALDELPADVLGPAIRRLASPSAGKQLAGAVDEYGSQVLICEVKHPGIGGQIVSSLGNAVSPRVQIATRDQAILVARYADEIKVLAEPNRRMVSELIAKQFDSFTSFLGKFANKNPKSVLFTGSCLIALESQAERILGGEEVVLDERGQPVLLERRGLIGRGIEDVSDNMAQPASAIGRTLAWTIGTPIGIACAILIVRRARPKSRAQTNATKARR